MSARKAYRSVAIYIYVRLLHIVELFFLIYVKTTYLAFYCYFRTTSIQRRFCGHINYTVEGTEIFQRPKKKKSPKNKTPQN